MSEHVDHSKCGPHARAETVAQWISSWFYLGSLALLALRAVHELSTVRVVDVSSTHVVQETRVMYENYLIADVQVTHFIKIDEVGFLNNIPSP